MKTVMTIVMLLTVLLCCGIAQAGLKDIIIGPPPAIKGEYESLDSEVPLIDDIGLLLGFSSTTDIRSEDNEFNIYGGIRTNLSELGLTAYFWPRSEEHTAYGFYFLRHFGYEQFILGTQFVGFEDTFGSTKGGDAYGFIVGDDVEISPKIYWRTMGRFRTFDKELAETHMQWNDKTIVSTSILFRF